MKILKIILPLFVILCIIWSFKFDAANYSDDVSNQVFQIQLTRLDGNNINTIFQNTGIFNQDTRTNNTPGFEWPKGSGKFANFTTGLTIGAMINGMLSQAAASYSGEYAPWCN